jgi:hypothetical protein
MKGKKNDFSMTFYGGEKKRLFMEYLHDTNKMINWVNSKQIEWTHVIVYDRRTREKIDRIIYFFFSFTYFLSFQMTRKDSTPHSF